MPCSLNDSLSLPSSGSRLSGVDASLVTSGVGVPGFTQHNRTDDVHLRQTQFKTLFLCVIVIVIVPSLELNSSLSTVPAAYHIGSV